MFKACFKRRSSHVPNVLETILIDNDAFQLIMFETRLTHMLM